MFCMKCGKKIDDDSTFCPYCGQKTSDNFGVTVPSNDTVITQGKRISKKLVIGLAGCVIAIVIVVGVVMLLLDRMDSTVAEQLFYMSWKEASELSDSEIEKKLDEENILYKTINQENPRVIMTQNTMSFMDADCLLVHGSSEVDNDTGFEPSLSARFSVLGIASETEEDFRNVRKEMEAYLNEQLIKGATVFQSSEEEGTSYLYAVEASDKNVEQFRTYVNDEVDLSDCVIYKFIQLYFVKGDELTYFDLSDFPSDKSYTDYMCEVTIFYTPMTQEDFVALAAGFDYDAVLEKNIDYGELRGDKELGALVEEVGQSDFNLRSIYFVDKHGIDIETAEKVNTDELKRIWYIKKFNYDIEMKETIDKEHWDSTAIYLAYTYDYDVTVNAYFKSDIDRINYLINHNYNPDTGERFGSETEARQWGMRNIGYDTQFGEPVDSSLIDALEEYQKYLDSWENKNIEGLRLVAKLIYLDDDAIPELLLIDDFMPAGGFPASNFTYLVKYTPEGLQESECECLHTLVYYVPKKGELYCRYYGGDSWNYGFFYDGLTKYMLTTDSSVLDEVETFFLRETYDENENLIEVEASEGLSLDFTLDDYIKSRQDFVDLSDQFKELRYSADNTLAYDIFDLYDDCVVGYKDSYNDSKTEHYLTDSIEVREFDLSDGVLTLAVDGGYYYEGNSSDGSEYQPFSICYPVAENCVWESGYYLEDFVKDKDINFEEMKQRVDEELEMYNDLIKEYGEENAIFDSPYSIGIDVTDGVITRVYNIQS